jgi:hypothetical protein
MSLAGSCCSHSRIHSIPSLPYREGGWTCPNIMSVSTTIKIWCGQQNAGMSRRFAYWVLSQSLTGELSETPAPPA